MKTIVVTTDFSKASVTAGKYAKALAAAFNAKLILFHAYERITPSTEGWVPVNSEETSSTAITNLLDQARDMDIAGLPYCYTKCEEGEPVETILRFAKRVKADLIIAGMKMEHKKFRKLFGSIVSSLCTRAAVPVLVVPEAAVFRDVNTMALAVQESPEKPVNPHFLDVFREIAELFHSSVYVVKVLSSETEHKMTFQHKPFELMKMLRSTDAVFETIEGDEVVEQLLQYIENKDLDLLAVMSHTARWIEKVFAESITKQLVFSAHIPLLVMNDRQLERSAASTFSNKEEIINK